MANLVKFLYTVMLSMALAACNKSGETEVVPLPTSVRLKTMHHNIPVRDVNVFIKYDMPEFPGYDKPASFFDTLIVTDVNGSAGIHPVRPGHHWAVAFGSSEHNIPLPIYGSMPFYIDPDLHPTVDTMIYMFE